MDKIEVKLLTGGVGCTKCDKVREKLEELQAEDDMNFEVKEINLVEQPELAQKYNLYASPGVVAKGELVAQGDLGKEKLRGKLEEVGK